MCGGHGGLNEKEERRTSHFKFSENISSEDMDRDSGGPEESREEEGDSGTGRTGDLLPL